jgi:hypothetical protein
MIRLIIEVLVTELLKYKMIDTKSNQNHRNHFQNIYFKHKTNYDL